MTFQLSATDYPSSVVRLRDEITKATVFCNFFDSEAGHVSGKTVTSVATEHNIFQALNHEESLASLPNNVKQLAAKHLSISSPKLFVICLVLSIDFSFIWKRKGDEIHSRFTDGSLPFSSKTEVEPSEESFFKSRVLPYQPSVLCPTFVNGDFDLVVHNSASIPIKKHGTQFAKGALGKVYKVSVHKDFLSLPDAAGGIDAVDEGWSRKLAMKEVSDWDAATREIKLVKALHAAAKKPAHILNRDGDLNDMFSNTDPPDKNDAARKWYQDQILGLAEAVKHIHNISPSLAGYIHDIKPANVVAFGKDRPTLKLIDWGCANVKAYIAGESSDKTGNCGDTCYMPPEATEADLKSDSSDQEDEAKDGPVTEDDGAKDGLFKKGDGKDDSAEEGGGDDHSGAEDEEMANSDNGDEELGESNNEDNGDEELEHSNNEYSEDNERSSSESTQQPVVYSRPYDIWSMACLYTDFMVWYTEGKDQYNAFVQGRKKMGGLDDFHFLGKTKGVVIDKLELLSKEKEWEGIVKLVNEMMVSKPKKRLTATQVVERLEAWIQQQTE